MLDPAPCKKCTWAARRCVSPRLSCRTCGHAEAGRPSEGASGARCCPGPPALGPLPGSGSPSHKFKSKTGKTRQDSRRRSTCPRAGGGEGARGVADRWAADRKWRLRQERTGWRGKTEVRKLLYRRGSISSTLALCKHLNNDHIQAGGGGGVMMARGHSGAPWG